MFHLRINWFYGLEEYIFEGKVNQAMLDKLFTEFVGEYGEQVRKDFDADMKQWGEALVRVMAPEGNNSFNAKKA